MTLFFNPNFSPVPMLRELREEKFALSEDEDFQSLAAINRKISSLKILSWLKRTISILIFTFFLAGCLKDDCTVVPPAPLAKPAADITSSGFTANWNRVIGGGVYDLQVASDENFSSVVFQQSEMEGSLEGGNSWPVTGLSVNTTYYYRVYAINDCGQSDYSNIISVTTLASLSSNTWSPVADLGGAIRAKSVGFTTGGIGYVCTGRVGSTPVRSVEVWAYDTASNTWTQKANFGGTARQEAAGFSIGTKGYLGTGDDGGNVKDFWEYNPASNTWTQKTDFGGAARESAVAFSIGGKGYIGTGAGSSGKTKDFWEYDPVANSWTQKTDFGGNARDEAIGFSIGSKGYIGTGNLGASTYVKDFWEYDPGTNTWIQKADFGGSGRMQAVGFSIGLKGYIGTGYDGTRLKDFWEYDPASDSWLQRTDFGGTPRYDAAAFSIGGKAYIGTGEDASARTKDFWEYIQ